MRCCIQQTYRRSTLAYMGENDIMTLYGKYKTYKNLTDKIKSNRYRHKNH